MGLKLTENDPQLKKIEEKIALFNDISNKIGDYLRTTKFDYISDDEEAPDEEHKGDPILQVENLQKYYTTDKKVLDDITFNVQAGEFFGIVGESGSGKSTLGKTIIRIIPNSGGTILFDGKYISSRHLSKPTKKWLAQNIQMVFQSPISSLNPKKKVLDLIKEPLTRSNLISKKVETLIQLHKILNFVFKDRIHLLTLDYKNDYIKKYYATLIFAYFTFNLKFWIYKAYIMNKRHRLDMDEFLNNISALYNKYTLSEENKDLLKGFYNPLYEISDINQLEIYKNVSLSAEQKQFLLKSFLNDSELLDTFEINVNHDINTIDDLFNENKDANDFVISAIDELDNNIKQVLSVVTKYFRNITEISRTILKKVSRKDFLPKESVVISTYNALQELKDEYNHNPLYDKIQKIITKRQNALHEFVDEYKQTVGFEAKNLFRTYIEASKEELNSVKRALINHAEEPFLFTYYEIKEAKLEEQIHLIKKLSDKKDLTYKQILFLIGKLNLLITKKYAPLFDRLKDLKLHETSFKGCLNELVNNLMQLKQDVDVCLKTASTEAEQYHVIKELTNELISENTTIYRQNEDNVQQQVAELTRINNEAQSILSRNKDVFLKQEIDEKEKQYEAAIKDYLQETIEYDEYSKNREQELTNEYNNIVNSYDPYLNHLITTTDFHLKTVGHLILSQVKEDKTDSINKDVVRDINRIKEGIASSFSELQEILSNTKTYLHLYNSQDPKTIKSKLVKHLTKLYVFETLESVGLKQEHAFRYIYDFSGGQRQRIAIARALITNPKLIIADEPISALDVSIQAQVVNIMKNLAKDRGITFLFIAHDLSMVHYACDRIIIINKGHILEKGDTDTIFDHPGHPYTRTLLKAVPELENINLDLAKESEKVDQPYSAYNPIESPTFYRLNNQNHFVYGTKEQVQKWNPDSIVVKG